MCVPSILSSLSVNSVCLGCLTAQTFSAMLAALQPLAQNALRVAAEDCVLQVDRDRPKLHLRDTALWLRVNKDWSSIAANASAKFKERHRLELETIATFQDVLFDSLSLALRNVCGNEVAMVAQALFVQKETRDKVASVAFGASQGVDAMDPKVVAGAALRPDAAQRLQEQHASWQRLTLALTSGADTICKYVANEDTVDMTTSGVVSILEEVAPREGDARAMQWCSDETQALCVEFAIKVARAVKRRLTQSLSTLVPFIVRLYSVDPLHAEMNSAFSKALVGEEPDASIDASLVKLESAAKFYKKHLSRLIVADKQLELEHEGCKAMVGAPFLAAAIMCAGVAKRVLSLTLGDEVDFKAQLHRLRTTWSVALQHLKRMGAYCAGALSKGSPDDFQRARAAMQYCSRQLKEHLSKFLEATRKEHAFIANSVAKLSSRPGLQDVPMLTADAVASEETTKRLLEIADTDEAEQLFSLFRRLDKILAVSEKVSQFLQPLAVEYAEDAVVDVNDIYSAHLKTVSDDSKQRSVDLADGGRILGNLTGAQALGRELQPGETRQQLVEEVRTGMPRKKFITTSPGVQKAMDAFFDNA